MSICQGGKNKILINLNDCFPIASTAILSRKADDNKCFKVSNAFNFILNK